MEIITKTIATLIILLISPIYFYAQEINNKHTRFYKMTNGVDIKVILTYDNDSKLSTRTTYIKDIDYKWAPALKHKYLYDNKGLLSEIVYIQKESLGGNWQTTSKRMIYSYDKNDRLTTIRQTDVAKEEYILTAEK